MKLAIEDIKHLSGHKQFNIFSNNLAGAANIKSTPIGCEKDNDPNDRDMTGSFNPPRSRLMKLFTKEESRKISEVHADVITIVDNVYSNIKEYNDDKDQRFLEKLMEICKKHRLAAEIAKMNRNLGMYFFQKNRISEAIELLCMAVTLAGKLKREEMLAAFNSDLGLLYFYNNDLIKAGNCYLEVDNMLPYINTDDDMLFLHNYRCGILYSNLQEYELARVFFEQALSFARSRRDCGNAIMNLGVIYKRQRNFNKAMEYYRDSLKEFDEDDYLSKSVVYNNLAELHKMYGQYEKALFYIDIAFKNLGNRNTAKTFIYFHTYTEIKILMGEPEQAFDKFLELLSQVEDYPVYKNNIIGCINDMALLASEDAVMLDKLEDAVIDMIDNSGNGDEEYLRELRAAVSNITMYKYDLKKQISIFI